MLRILATIVCLGASLLTLAPAHAQTVSGLAFPTRRGDPSRIAEQLERVTRLVQHAIAPDAQVPTSSTEPLNLSPRIQHAHDAYVAGQLDSAATEMDAAIEEGVAHLSALRDPQQFLQALLIRATIGLARGEGDRVGGLLERALRYDPSLELTATERTPALRAALERARLRTGTHPEIRAEDLGGACASTPILIVARMLEEHTLEVSRFDQCRFVAAALIGGAIDEAAAANALTGGSPARAGLRPSSDALPASRHPGWTFGLAGGLGLAVTAAGAGLVGSVVPEYSRLQKMCAGGTCAPSVAEPYARREIAGYVLVGVGAAAATSGLVAWLVLRHRR